MKQVQLLKQHVLEDVAKDGKSVERVTNNPGSVLSLPDAEADALIANGTAAEYTPPAEAAPAGPAEDSGSSAGAPAAVIVEADGHSFREVNS
ncbi:MAG: hypothetical protein JNM76_14645 [Betaproteobacteria bacterium]|nr:hypothetical protein [Betaproteobacteria bacterium]